MSEELEQVSNFDQDIEFIIGHAGTGKSTLLVKRSGPKTLILTPTHKAAGVLINKGLQNVYTIHSTLSLVPTLNMEFRKRGRMQKLTKIGDTDLSTISYVLIDEFSMVSQEILDQLLEVLPAHCKVTVFGDPFQLPPVSGTQIEPELYTDKITKLTKQYRSEAPQVVETFERFVHWLEEGGKADLRIYTDKTPDLIKGDISSFNPETDRILAYTNKRVQELNELAHSLLGGVEEFKPGDEVVINGMYGTVVEYKYCSLLYPSCMSKGKLMPDDKLHNCINKTTDDIEKYNTDLSSYSQICVEIKNQKYNIYYDYNHYVKLQELKKKVEDTQILLIKYHNIPSDVKIADWCKANRGAKYVKERGQAWQEYIAHTNLVFNVQRPYSSTVHKAQGSEFSTVFIDQDDIKKSIRNGYYEQYARLMYVALSRAINKVVIL